MAKQIIDIGTVPNDGTGDPLRTAFTKSNENFTELYDNQFSGDYGDLSNTPTIPSTLTDLSITDGTNGQVLTTDGGGNFTFEDSAGGGSGAGLTSRQTLSDSTGSIANDASANLDITGYKGYLLYKIQTTGAAWIRIYSSSASRTNDASRTSDQYPADDSGVIAEVIASGADTITLTPGVVGFNDDSPVSDNIAVAVTNLTGGVADITVSLTAVQLEV